jgi:L-ascorbate metabolism protein UlaG (beta-lactamase superfamily)
MKIRLLRHATLVIEINDKKLLIDPMLSPKDGLDPVPNCGNDIRIPMVELPVSKEELTKILEEADAVVVTHLHRDHWDVAAQNLINKNKQLFCQPGDSATISGQGFKNVQTISAKLEWEGITIIRTDGQHGTGEIGKKMGTVSGFVFKYEGQSIYLAGDTIWCEDVEKALLEHAPQVTIVNAGGAQFLTGDPITMTPEDIIQVHEKCPATKIIAVHMDTVNHCFIKRTDLVKALSEKKPGLKVLVPGDGEEVADFGSLFA